MDQFNNQDLQKKPNIEDIVSSFKEYKNCKIYDYFGD